MAEPRPWESLAGFLGDAEACTCSDDQLNLVGCDCGAQQNLPIQCECGRWLRTPAQIADRECGGCRYDESDVERDPVELIGPEFADDISLEERWEHYAFEERNGMPYGSSF